MRRFELIEGNKAKFWEIVRNSNVIATRSGNIGVAGKTREKTFEDFMAAEVEFDRLIRERIRKGYAEVDEPTLDAIQHPYRGVLLSPLDGSDPIEFDARAMKYILWRMVEVELFDRFREPPDLTRWRYRAARTLRLPEEPVAGDERYQEWAETWLELTKGVRSVPMLQDKVATFKFTEGLFWIVSAEECRRIAAEAANRSPKRHRPKATEQEVLDAWVSFHQEMVDIGYEITPLD